MKSNEWLFQMKNKERFVANLKGLSYSSMAIKDIAWGSWMMGLICVGKWKDWTTIWKEKVW